MSYLDYMSKGMQNTYGGGYTQLFRKPQYTQIGQTKMTQPTRIGIDNMYGQSPFTQGLPELAPAPTYPGLPGGGTIGEGQYGADYEEYLEASDEWNKIWVAGRERWMPANPTEGQIFDDEADQRWIFQGSEWQTAVTGGAYTLLTEYERYLSVLPSDKRDINYEDWLILGLGLSFIDNAGMEYKYHDWTNEDFYNALKLAGMSDANIRERYHEALTGRGWAGTPLETMEQGIEAHLGGEEYVITEDWQVGFQDVLDKMSSGEISYIDDNGLFDTTQLREQGAMGEWLADMLEESYKTGDLAGDFYETDEEGNVVLNEDLQGMLDWFSGADETIQKQYEDYNRALARHSIQSGHSINSGYYSEAFAGAVANRAMQVTEQMSTQMMEEMEAQYNYIAKSMEDMLRDMGRDTEAGLFADAMRIQWEQAHQAYVEQARELATQIGETEGAMYGQFFSSLLILIISFIL